MDTDSPDVTDLTDSADLADSTDSADLTDLVDSGDSYFNPDLDRLAYFQSVGYYYSGISKAAIQRIYKQQI